MGRSPGVLGSIPGRRATSGLVGSYFEPRDVPRINNLLFLQIFSHGSGVFSSVSSGDKSVAFWSLDAGGESLTGCRTGPPAPMTGISCATPLAAPFSLLFGGSAFSTSAAVDTPPSLASSSSAKCILSFCNLHQDACVTAAPSSGVVVGTLALGGGHLSAMATLPHTLRDSLLTGTSAGSLCLFY